MGGRYMAGLRIFGILAWAAAPCSTQAQAPAREAGPPVIDAAMRQSVVDRLARLLDSLYVLPSLGATLAAHVRDRLSQHAYDTLSSPRAFADALSHDLDAIAHDLHLWVRYFPPPSGPVMPDLDETWLNHGYQDVRILDGNIAYLNIRNFTQSPEAERACAAAMTLLTDADAIIIDIRNNGGGTTPMMTRVASYFFADSVHLSDLHWRDIGRTFHIWADPGSVQGPHLSRQRVYVLTSRRTFSAAENFAYSFQAVHRASIIGETTRGGAHTTTGPKDLGFGIRALVPSGENLHPVTGATWEGVGVQPDVAVPDSVALRTAHRLALEELIRGAAAGPRRDRLERAHKALP